MPIQCNRGPSLTGAPSEPSCHQVLIRSTVFVLRRAAHSSRSRQHSMAAKVQLGYMHRIQNAQDLFSSCSDKPNASCMHDDWQRVCIVQGGCGHSGAARGQRGGAEAPVQGHCQRCRIRLGFLLALDGRWSHSDHHTDHPSHPC